MTTPSSHPHNVVSDTREAVRAAPVHTGRTWEVGGARERGGEEGAELVVGVSWCVEATLDLNY